MARRSKGEETRAAILDHAVEVASRVGLEGLTIGSLADATGMSKSGLFAHFGSREDLQLAALEHVKASFGEQVLGPVLCGRCSSRGSTGRPRPARADASCSRRRTSTTTARGASATRWSTASARRSR
jgi:AcrR family transcriptional regulator